MSTLKIHARTLSHHVTWFLGTRFPQVFPLVFVVGYLKSGSTWAAQLVAHVLELPFPRFSLLPIGCPAVVHGHERVWKRYPKCVYVMRDGRDVMVSQYFFMSKSIPDGDNPRMTARQHRMFPSLVNKVNVHDNLTAFVNRMMRKPESARANWGEHLRSYYASDNPNVVLLRYEDLMQDGPNTLGRVMSELTGEEADADRVRESLDRFSFERQAGRRRGDERRSNFLRKGLVGDWTNHFTRSAAEAFDRSCGDMLIRAGYETDRSWVESCNPALPDPAAALTTGNRS